LACLSRWENNFQTAPVGSHNRPDILKIMRKSKMAKIPVEIIANEALVVRGGRNHPENIQRAIRTHPSGITGISVECAVELSVAELALAIRHGQVGVTTVAKVRSEGGDVIRTSGRSLNHATLTGLTPEKASLLLTPTIPNPSRT
jgi:hypothetical protein